MSIDLMMVLVQMEKQLDIHYLPYTSTHLNELVEMWRDSLENAVGIKDPNPVSKQKNYFTKKVLPNNSVRVALHGCKVVGFELKWQA